MESDKLFETSNLLKMAEESPQILEEMIIEGEFPLKISLTEYLCQLLLQKGLAVMDVVRISLLSKSYVYQVLNGERMPSRDVLIRLGLSMSCTIEEIQHLLTIGQAGVLYPKVRRDAAILCGISQQLTLAEVDEFLNSIGERSLL